MTQRPPAAAHSAAPDLLQPSAAVSAVAKPHAMATAVRTSAKGRAMWMMRAPRVPACAGLSTREKRRSVCAASCRTLIEASWTGTNARRPNPTHSRTARLGHQSLQRGEPLQERGASVFETGAPVSLIRVRVNQRGEPLQKGGASVFETGAPVSLIGDCFIQRDEPLQRRAASVLERGTAVSLMGTAVSLMGTPVSPNGHCRLAHGHTRVAQWALPSRSWAHASRSMGTAVSLIRDRVNQRGEPLQERGASVFDRGTPFSLLERRT